MPVPDSPWGQAVVTQMQVLTIQFSEIKEDFSLWIERALARRPTEPAWRSPGCVGGKALASKNKTAMEREGKMST